MLRPDSPAPDLPHGFRPLPGSTLVVPEVLSRTREVWPKDEGRLLDRAIALLQPKHLKIMLKCDRPDCPDRAIERIKGVGTEFILRCGCTDRVFTRAF